MEGMVICLSYMQWYRYQPKHKIIGFQILAFQECNFISLTSMCRSHAFCCLVMVVSQLSTSCLGSQVNNSAPFSSLPSPDALHFAGHLQKGHLWGIRTETSTPLRYTLAFLAMHWSSSSCLILFPSIVTCLLIHWGIVQGKVYLYMVLVNSYLLMIVGDEQHLVIKPQTMALNPAVGTALQL